MIEYEREAVVERVTQLREASEREAVVEGVTQVRKASARSERGVIESAVKLVREVVVSSLWFLHL